MTVGRGLQTRQGVQRMLITKSTLAVVIVAAFAAGIGAHTIFRPTPVHAAAANHVFELRTYTTPSPAKLEALKARFRDHTIKIFEKHGMKSIGYWVPTD